MGKVEMETGNYETAQMQAEEALNWAKKRNARQWEGMAWSLLGQITGKKDPDDFEKAEEFILKGKNIFEALRLKTLIAESHLHLGELYNSRGRKNDALIYLKNAVTMFSEMEMPYFINRTREVLAQLSES
jgi:tetratricopeptide (TPR) repeat protein